MTRGLEISLSRPEEFDYLYDTDGRLLVGTFAQTPTGTDTDYSAHGPSSFAQTQYEYDAAGRTRSVATTWTDNSGSTPTVQPVLGNNCTYELTGVSLGPARGLKTSSTTLVPNTGLTDWTNLYTETYGYDTGNDMLTSFSTTDGLPNADQTWSYDAAGNRNDAGNVDNLNRVATLGGTHIEHDILGNRLFAGPANAHVADYTWDPLNRMLSYSANGASTSYSYRADGMRVRKTGQYATTSYRYDGQMGFEDVEVNNGVTTVTRSVLGARGVDSITKGSAVSYPLYDAHGNMVATLSKTTNGATVGNQRVLDPWGVVRQGATTGEPSGRYCANLGHKQDDESGLVYMRARYYEPASGRFISEDRVKDGQNWIVYCHGNPVALSDESGNFSLLDTIAGTADEAYEKFQECQQGRVTLDWARNAVQRSLQKWAETVGDGVVDVLGDQEFMLEGRTGVQTGHGIQLTGVDGQYSVGIVNDGASIVVKTYKWGVHLVQNVEVPFAPWW